MDLGEITEQVIFAAHRVPIGIGGAGELPVLIEGCGPGKVEVRTHSGSAGRVVRGIDNAGDLVARGVVLEPRHQVEMTSSPWNSEHIGAGILRLAGGAALIVNGEDGHAVEVGPGDGVPYPIGR